MTYREERLETPADLEHDLGVLAHALEDIVLWARVHGGGARSVLERLRQGELSGLAEVTREHVACVWGEEVSAASALTWWRQNRDHCIDLLERED